MANLRMLNEEKAKLLRQKQQIKISIALVLLIVLFISAYLTHLLNYIDPKEMEQNLNNYKTIAEDILLNERLNKDDFTDYTSIVFFGNDVRIENINKRYSITATYNNDVITYSENDGTVDYIFSAIVFPLIVNVILLFHIFHVIDKSYKKLIKELDEINT